MTGRITKIKQADGRIIIRAIEGEGETVEKEVVFKSAQDPHPDLIEAFRALEEHARSILEWPSNYAMGRVRITGVTFSMSESTGVEGAVMTGQVALESADAPFSFNTPHLAFDQYSEGGASKLMSVEAQEALAVLRLEAEAFMSGEKRAQGDIFANQKQVAA